MASTFLLTYAPHKEDIPLFTSPMEDGFSLLHRLVELLRQRTLYFVAANEHADTNSHWHFAGKLNEESASHGKDWFPRLLKPYFPKIKSTVKATDTKWVPESDILKSMAYCQKEHGDNIIYHNITEEQKKIMDEINAATPERDLVTYNIIKSQNKFCCEVMRLCDSNEDVRKRLSAILCCYAEMFYMNEMDEARKHLTYYNPHRTTRMIIQVVAPYNLIYTGNWNNVITTLYSMWNYRGWAFNL